MKAGFSGSRFLVAIQPKYDLEQDQESPKFHDGYPPYMREFSLQRFGIDPMESEKLTDSPGLKFRMISNGRKATGVSQ